MFEELFTKPNTIERYRAAPLVEPRERYLRHLAESGARRLTLRQIALDQVRLLHVLDLRVTRWLRYLGWLDEPEEDRHPYSVELGAFEEWMCTERGHAEGTISNRLRSAKEFLDWLAARGKRFASVQVSDIDGAIEAKKARRH